MIDRHRSEPFLPAALPRPGQRGGTLSRRAVLAGGLAAAVAPGAAEAAMPADDPSTPATCGPDNRFVADAGEGRALAVRLVGTRPNGRTVLLDLAATGVPVENVVVELRRGGRAVARGGVGRVTRTTRRVRAQSPLGPDRGNLGPHVLVVRVRGRVVLRADVVVTRAPRS